MGVVEIRVQGRREKLRSEEFDPLTTGC